MAGAAHSSPDEIRHRNPRRNEQQTEQNYPSAYHALIIALFRLPCWFARPLDLALHIIYTV